jgi:spore coat polysaccharide biosynthesis predicted glycosyltransferase SpsG
MKTACFYVDEKAGNGHRVRCGALKDELVARGWRILSKGSRAKRDVSIFDGYGYRKEDFKRVRKLGRVVVIDDYQPKRIPAWVDLIINGTVGARQRFGDAYRCKDMALGPELALLRTGFRSAKWTVGQWTGGGVLDLRHIKGWSEARFVFALTTCGVAITYGGMTALECACVGVPMVVVCASEDQKENAYGLAKAGAAVSSTETGALEEAKNVLKEWSGDELAYMSRAGRSLVDGRGVIRVANEIEDLV